MLFQSPLLLALFAFTVAGTKIGYYAGKCTPAETNACASGVCAIWKDEGNRNLAHACVTAHYCQCATSPGQQLEA
ncbi:hypothetical protein PtrV1_09470 [Pyrenophora tritici-repentis]|nr:uncharacterized protein PTRG_10801 [Pyrenophora tritici-repentis Pt-1C-BFP]EDU43851.1 predicted protein [Pyrenophora tritici-repentis Pt-1C-BFP]KAA8617963.1 hypothetical protein PtrV1_09470 [Pyrenophora tritici-repentis]KAI1669358.1 hypothetical protein L13192_06817 [Pyrenophora tritici-repentis]